MGKGWWRRGKEVGRVRLNQGYHVLSLTSLTITLITQFYSFLMFVKDR